MMSSQNALVKLSIDPFVRTATSSQRKKTAAQTLVKEYGPILDHFNDVVFITDEEGYFVFVNKAVTEQSNGGVPPEVFIGRNFTELVDPNDHDFAKNIFQKVLNGEKIVPAIEMERQTASGEKITKEVSWKILSWNNGETFVMGISRDVTDRKLAQEALIIARDELEMQNEKLRKAQKDMTAERDKYSDLYDFAPVGYFTISDKGLILGANLMGATMLGLERGKPTNIYFSEFIANDYQDAFYQHRRKLFKSARKQSSELKITKKDGTEFYAQLESSPVKDEAGNCIALRSSLSDINERKQAEVERERLIIKLQEALDNIKTLKGLLPICANCKKIRDDNGYWNQIEAYIRNHSEAKFSHSICPVCAEKLYPELIK
jgi:PAS domain S-box-containing protein